MAVWLHDPFVLFDLNKADEFYPDDKMTYEEKLNSFMRFSIYFSIVVFLLNKNYKVFYAIFFSGIVTLILYQYKNDILEQSRGEIESYRNHTRSEECTHPQENNPFMNVLISEYEEDPDRKEACDVDNNKVQDKMKDLFYNDIFRSVDEVYDNNYSYRQFYTTPNTMIPNDQEGFAKWLYYSEEKTHKEKHIID